MTDRINGFFVALEDDVRIDDAEPLMAAVRMLRGVLKVEPNVTDMSTYVTEERLRKEIGKRLIEVVYPKPERNLR